MFDGSVPHQSSSADELAAAAVRLFRKGGAPSVDQAIRIVASRMGMENFPRPSHSDLRKHAQAQEEEEIGVEGREARIQSQLFAALHLLEALAGRFPGSNPLLLGRAARGQLDLDPALHLRIDTDSDAPHVAQALVDLGCGEAKCTSQQITKGRVDRFDAECAGVPLSLLRIPSAMRVSFGIDAVSGRPIACVDAAGLRTMLAK
ncbi:MAG: hypothetical protein EXS10_09840 [Phycisphaerales bacterium]|nr:hypothetical protein [Phycisphaerales bacterium]